MTSTNDPFRKQILLAKNYGAYATVLNATRIVDDCGQAHGWPVPTEMFSVYEDATAKLHRSTVALVGYVAVGDVIFTIDGHASTVTTITDDGFDVSTDLDNGQRMVQTFTAAGRTFHGYYEGEVLKSTG